MHGNGRREEKECQMLSVGSEEKALGLTDNQTGYVRPTPVMSY